MLHFLAPPLSSSVQSPPYRPHSGGYPLCVFRSTARIEHPAISVLEFATTPFCGNGSFGYYL